MAEPTTIQELARQIREDQERLLRNERRKVGILLFLLVFVFGYMTWIYTSVSKLNAEMLTQQAGTYVESQLPAWRKELEAQTLQEAPALGNKLQEMLLDMPRTARNSLEKSLQAQGQRALREMEQALVEFTDKAIQQEIAHLAERTPAETTNEEKLDLVMASLRKDFKLKVKAYLQMHYDSFSGEVRTLAQRLERLHLPVEQLTPKERVERELIEVSVVLFSKHHKLEKDHIFKFPFPSVEAAKDHQLME